VEDIADDSDEESSSIKHQHMFQIKSLEPGLGSKNAQLKGLPKNFSEHDFLVKDHNKVS
jgi:hypothetical protein